MQSRTRTEYKFEPEGEGLPETFSLIGELVTETRRSNRENWYQDYSMRSRTVAAAELSRGQVAALIASGADWLAWTGED